MSEPNMKNDLKMDQGQREPVIGKPSTKKPVKCPTCGQLTTELYLCDTAGCQYAKRSGCLNDGFDWVYGVYKCPNGHAAHIAWSSTDKAANV